MYPRATSNPLSLLRFFVACAVLLLGVVKVGYGQDKKRTYANFQGTYEAGINLLGLGLLTGAVSDDENAIDGSVTTYSTLSVPTGVANLLSATQFLEFTTDGNHSNVRTISAGTPVTVKSSFPAEILGLLANVEIGYFNDLKAVNGGLTNRAGYNTSNRTVEYSGAALLNLLNGTGQFEVTFAPEKEYQGIFVRLSGNGLSVLLSNKLFHAYIYEDYTYASCEEKHQPLDVLHGTRSAAIGALELGGVTDPYNILDTDYTDYATMNVGVGALNTIYLNTIFATPSDPGQVVRVVVERPGSILDLSVLSSFSIQPYNRNVAIGSPIIASSSPISARLLPGTHKYELAFKVNDPFDRIELRFDNTVTVLTSLRVYEVSRLPRVEVNEDPSEPATLEGCESIHLDSLIANYQPEYYDYHYYDSDNNEIDPATIKESGTHTIGIEAIDKENGCVSPRAEVTFDVIIHPLPSVTISPMPTACEGDNIVNIPFINPVGNPTDYSIEWTNASGDFENIDWIESASTLASPIEVSIPTTTVMGEYEGILRVRNENCESDDIPFTLKVLPRPGKPHLTITDVYN